MFYFPHSLLRDVHEEVGASDSSDSDDDWIVSTQTRKSLFKTMSPEKTNVQPTFAPKHTEMHNGDKTFGKLDFFAAHTPVY